MSEPDLKTLWQDQPTEYDPMTIADIHAKATAFQTRIRRRNRIDYVGCALVIAGFAPLLFRTESWMLQAGGAMIILAVLFVGWQLHRRASAEATPQAGAAVVDFHREQLVRQQAAVRSIAWWYMAPMAPGMVMLMLGRLFQAHVPGRSLEMDRMIIVLCMLIVALVFLVVWLLNRLAVHRVQKLIDELDAQRRG
jgi:hypothetical protein